MITPPAAKTLQVAGLRHDDKWNKANMVEIFERPLPAIALPFTGERFTSAVTGQIEIEHFHRYLYAREFCRGKDVLDIASGEGYGSALLAQVASSVTGVEIARDAVEHASASYRRANLRFLEGDARRMEIDSTSVDVVVCFETIEHFAEHDRFLKEVRRVLRPTGIFILSTPDRYNYSPANTPANPYHVSELSREEFTNLLSRYFEHVLCFGQRPIGGSVLFPCEGAPSDATPLCFEKRGRHFEMSQGLPRALYLVALASAKKISAISPSILIEPNQIDAAHALRQELDLAKQELASARSDASKAEFDVTTLRQELDLARQEFASARSDASKAEFDVTTLRQELDLARQELASARSDAESECRSLAEQISDCQRQLAAAQSLISSKDKALAATYGSMSWKLTRPLRVAKGFLAKTRG